LQGQRRGLRGKRSSAPLRPYRLVRQDFCPTAGWPASAAEELVPIAATALGANRAAQLLAAVRAGIGQGVLGDSGDENRDSAPARLARGGAAGLGLGARGKDVVDQQNRLPVQGLSSLEAVHHLRPSISAPRPLVALDSVELAQDALAIAGAVEPREPLASGAE